MNWKVLALFLVAAFSVSAQNLSTPQTLQTVDESRLVALHGTVHPLARAANDRGRVSDSLPMQRLLLTLARPADRERDLQQFLEDAHTPGSPAYHQWLTPQQYGARFGATDADVQVVSAWLQVHGFSVAHIASNRSVIEFSGTAGQVREALHAEMHRYNVSGVDYTANSGEIVVPEAISSRVSGFAPLNSFPLTSYVERVGSATLNRGSHQVSPRFTVHENNAPFYAFGPEDFATQYDVAPLYAAGINGTGVTIGIIGDGNIDIALVDAYRILFNLPADHARMIIDGVDPGDPNSPNVEGYLDTEVSGAIAPNATVNYYIASGSPFQDPLSLAALRAVEDNQASVLSVSYGQCEVELGEAGNQLWAGLWQQAAAQGQTVFVSSGDSGPSTCAVANITGNNIQGLFSVNVNGIGSTPWNVSVGGTDFYYSDYAKGEPSAATYWNQTNDSAKGSLKAVLAEQPWDDSLGFDLGGGLGQQSAAGGGGVSSCSQETLPVAGGLPTCIAGYAKPAWQNAPGVPNDKARDLPDVSLFASNGANLSAAPICAEAGDCAPVTSGDPQITLVGGTSVSSPSMAGVFALVNQKYGRQGQANYTLYALARQFPAVFHDITLGTNDIVCPANLFPDCNVPVPGYSFEDSYGKFAAGPGYDLASGLGSVDVNLMLTDWTKITYVSTTTTLQATPGTIVHGSPVSISVTVAAGSGSGAGSAAPTGNVSLSAGSGTPILANTPLTLAGGSASAHLTNLPGGTYPLTAQYAGGGNFSSSTSAPVSLTVTPESSSTGLNLQYISGAANGSVVLGVGKITSGAQVPFGSTWAFQATPTGVNTQTTGLATGTATFTDGATSVVVPVGSGGAAVWSPPILAVGAHSIAASYSGDASYAASSAGPVAFTVVKGNPALTATPEVQPATFGSLGGPGMYQAGTTLVVHVLISQRGVPTTVAPTGTVTVTFGALTQTVALTVDPYLTQALATAFVTLPNVPVGTYTPTASYSGDSNWNPASYVAPSAMTYVSTTASPTITTLTLSRSSVDSSGGVTFNVSVQATSSTLGSPFGQVLLYANGTLFGGLVVTNGSGSTSSGSDTIPASEIPYGALQVVAEYVGSINMDPSISSAVPLTVTVSDFSLTAASRNLSIASGQSASVPVALSGPPGAGLTVALTCAPSSPSIRCSVSPTPASFTGSGTGTLTISAFTLSSAAAIPERPQDERTPSSRVAVAAAFVFLLLLPNRKRGRLPLVALVAALCLSTGCGHSSSPAGSQTGQQTQTPALAGSYSVVVTGASGSITHNATVSFSVQ